MKRLLTLALAAAAAGCGEQHLAVQVSLDGEPVAGAPVWLLPYDRAALLDSLVQESDEPEPAIPAPMIAQLDTLRQRERQAGGDTTAAVLRQRRVVLEARIDSIRVARTAWRDRVYAPFDSLARFREGELGIGARSDTTDAAGLARLPAGEGRFWVWAAYVVPEGSLEWNVPVTLHGDTAAVRLTRENATERRLY